MRGLPLGAQAYIGSVVVLSGVLIALGPLDDIDFIAVVSIAILFFIAEEVRTPLGKPAAAISPSLSVALASVVLTGPIGAALVHVLAALSNRHRPMVKAVFNVAQGALSAYAAGTVYLYLGGEIGVPDIRSFPWILVPFAAAAVTYALVNGVLVILVIWLTTGVRPFSLNTIRWQPLIALELASLGYGMLGLFAAVLWAIVGPFSVVLLLLPLLIAKWTLDQCLEQQRAYDATVATLCQAVETKDYYTRGHCMRVSQGSVLLAKEIGMRADRVEAIKMAGMLHDVGKLGVPTRVLQKPGALTEEEYAAIQLHPMRGYDIVREIGFLHEALAGIMHHHERMDGRGYPMGLAGKEIPEFARAIAVADAFDSMTSTRSYRNARSIDEAVAELRRSAGSHFDTAMVDAFIKAIRREGWELPDIPQVPDIGIEVTQQDHDDPSTPIRVAGEPGR
ncbi:HD-GYP domain-containing protein [Allonocardiopsis opalescens]|uniref:HD-GYP domain-containing protein (C-di-GMP phosphodiesterase class II) n=1 Tax=Allonocardiopsis opalescens TaxID=1144618 RepID=A0A2T0QDR5_9ACTN|nr:HD-GYP domain-containing protein [Allonocardiopsis opalescens]PRY02048.1 HD-GYP domain-containing protein (c-di-GMP phosphodiesterase class II) [Allonocardiopsis opalescens]